MTFCNIFKKVIDNLCFLSDYILLSFGLFQGTKGYSGLPGRGGDPGEDVSRLEVKEKLCTCFYVYNH